MITVDTIKNIVTTWASSLPYKVRIHLFGSLLKGNPNPSDIDISLEVLEFESLSEDEQKFLWYDNHTNWENYLSEKCGMKVDLCFYEKKKENMPKYLAESSLLLYDSTEKEDES